MGVKRQKSLLHRPCAMVFMSDGCSIHYARTWSKSGISICWRHLVTSKESSNSIFIRKNTMFYHSCAKWNEQPFNIKTMIQIQQNINKCLPVICAFQELQAHRLRPIDTHLALYTMLYNNQGLICIILIWCSIASMECPLTQIFFSFIKKEWTY